jgi:hypothetical protein
VKNALMWKRILNEGVWVPSGMEWFEHRVVVSPIIVSAIPFESSGDGTYLYDWARFKGIALPFTGSFWLEAPVIGEFVDGTPIPPSARTGALVSPIRKPSGEWVVRCTYVSEATGGKLGVSAAILIGLNARGDLMPGGDQIGFYERMCFLSFEGGNVPINDFYSGIADFVLRNLEMMSCKNVVLEARDNEPKQILRAQKRHGVNAYGYRYHVLVVRPPGAPAGSLGHDVGVMPRHVCRGHFAEYGPEFNKGLLFGKYGGRFYIPPHLKGRLENGEVAKDYQIGGAA